MAALASGIQCAVALQTMGAAGDRECGVGVIVPEGLESLYDDWHMAPLITHGGIALVSGVTATTWEGPAPPDPEEEFVSAFENLARVLAAGGMDMGDVLEMTTYHVDLQRHLETFRRVRDRFVVEPWPAWSAIGTTGLATPGIRLEMTVHARVGARATDEPAR